MSAKLKEIGVIITAARLNLGISKNKMATKLELPFKYLELIENGEFDKNYHNALVSRYLRIYLNYLNLDTEDIIKTYKESFDEYKSGKHKFTLFDYKLFSKKLITKLIIIFLLCFFIASKTINYKYSKIEEDFTILEKALHH